MESSTLRCSNLKRRSPILATFSVDGRTEEELKNSAWLLHALKLESNTSKRSKRSRKPEKLKSLVMLQFEKFKTLGEVIKLLAVFEISDELPKLKSERYRDVALDESDRFL